MNEETRKEIIIHERPFIYTRDTWTGEEHGWLKFPYTATYFDVDESNGLRKQVFDSYLFCSNRLTFLELLAIWNRGPGSFRYAEDISHE